MREAAAVGVKTPKMAAACQIGKEETAFVLMCGGEDPPWGRRGFLRLSTEGKKGADEPPREGKPT